MESFTKERVVQLHLIQDETEALLQLLTPIGHGAGSQGSTGLVEFDRTKDEHERLTDVGLQVLHAAAQQAAGAWRRLDRLAGDLVGEDGDVRSLVYEAVHLMALVAGTSRITEEDGELPAASVAWGALTAVEDLHRRVTEAKAATRATKPGTVLPPRRGLPVQTTLSLELARKALAWHVRHGEPHLVPQASGDELSELGIESARRCGQELEGAWQLLTREDLYEDRPILLDVLRFLQTAAAALQYGPVEQQPRSELKLVWLMSAVHERAQQLLELVEEEITRTHTEAA